MAENSNPATERRGVGNDRRKNPRSGRRSSDPHTNWRRIAWLFAAYALYLSIWSLPSAVKSTVMNFFKRSEPTPS